MCPVKYGGQRRTISCAAKHAGSPAPGTITNVDLVAATVSSSLWLFSKHTAETQS